ncbi:MAG: hypothetical protein ACJAV4_000612 [Pontimonas sp.]|jgi:hypothetical protein
MKCHTRLLVSSPEAPPVLLLLRVDQPADSSPNPDQAAGGETRPFREDKVRGPSPGVERFCGLALSGRSLNLLDASRT